MYYVYINTHTCMYAFKKKYDVYILNLFIYNITEYKYTQVNACKYFLNVYGMCVYLYIHNKYTQYTHILTKIFILDVINRYPALRDAMKYLSL